MAAGGLVNGDGIQPGLDGFFVAALAEEGFSQPKEMPGALQLIACQLLGRAIVTLGLSVGKDSQGPVAGFLIVMVSAVYFFGLLEMVGQGVIIFGSQLFQRLSDAAVQARTAQPADAFLQGHGDQAVFEGKGILAVAILVEAGRLDFVNELSALGSFERVDEGVLVQVTGKAQGVVVELSPDDGSQAQHILGLGGELAEAGLDSQADALGKLDIIQAGDLPVAGFANQLALFDQGLANLFDVEEIAFGFAEDGFNKIGGDRFLEHDFEHLAGLLAVEAGQLDPFGQALAVQVQEHIGQAAAAVNIGFAVSKHDQQPALGEAGTAGQVADQVKGFTVCPLNIFNHQQGG